MRISLFKIEQIDEHIFGRSTTEDRLIFEAMLILDPALKFEVLWQKRSLGLVQQYGRKKVKAEIESAHQKLFNEPAHGTFRNKILNLFK
jgi:hypothetical protein